MRFFVLAVSALSWFLAIWNGLDGEWSKATYFLVQAGIVEHYLDRHWG